MSGQPRVWIVLVNWNGWRDTIECLESVLRMPYAHMGVIVCDNASSDGSLEQLTAWASGANAYQAPAGKLAALTTPSLPKPLACQVLEVGQGLPDVLPALPLLFVKTGGNLGFAGGNNVGIRLALADPHCAFVWLLNNDTVVETACLQHLVNAASADPGIGITGSVNYFYGQPETVQALGGGSFARRRVFSDLLGHRLRKNDITPAIVAQAQASLDWVSGASMFVSRRFLEQTGLMEEAYFLYYEEIDWALRSERHFRNALAPQAVLYHKSGGATGEKTDGTFAVYTRCRSRFKLYRKLLPAWLPACYLRTGRDCLVEAVRGRRANAQAILRAGIDDLLQR